MNMKTLNKNKILNLYLKNKEKGKYWVADQLKLNRSSVSTLINKYLPNSNKLDIELESKLLEAIRLFPYTGTKKKISFYLGVSKHSIEQIIHKTKINEIIEYFNKPKCHTYKLNDNDIQDILDGSKKGIGNDQMGLIKGVDGISIRNVRKKLLTKEEYKLYHSIDRFYSGDYNSYYNDRGDKFLSTWEEKVADYLYLNNIKYYSNVRIHYNDKNYSPDFYLPKSRTFIEVFGMSNVESYKLRMNEKIQFYNDNKIKCLFLFEEDFLKNKKYINQFQQKLLDFNEQTKNMKYNLNIKKVFLNKLKINKDV